MTNVGLAPQTVFVVDDDEAVRDSLHWLLEARNLDVRSFASGATFLAAASTQWHGCVVLDVRMPEMSGFEVFESMRTMGITLPTVFLSGHGDVPMAVSAFKKGAVDFIEKPVNDQALIDALDKYLQLEREQYRRQCQSASISRRLESLTPREREVMDRIVIGKLNKQIADELKIGIKTVEVHRSRVMEKMGASTLAELIRCTIGAPMGHGRSTID